MASTRLVRKELRNRTVSKKRISSIKRLTAKPVLKNVDIEQIKKEFANKKAKAVAKKEAPVKETLKAVKEVVENQKAEVEVAAPEVKEEKKTAPKKATAKKATPKAKKEVEPKAKEDDSKAAE